MRRSLIILRQGAVCRDEALDRSQRGVEQRRQRLLQRDLVNLSAIERIADLARLLRLLAVRSSTVLNVDGLARDADMPTTTVRRYLTLLDAAYLVVLLPAWSNNRTTRAIRAPKIVLADSGLCTDLVGADADRLASPLGDPGPLLETIVATEIRKQLGWCIDRPRMFFTTGPGTASRWISCWRPPTVEWSVLR